MIKKYFATKDNTITNAFKVAAPTINSIRATGSSMGAAEVLEVFTIYGAASPPYGEASDAKELQRVIIEFDISQINSDITSGIIPSGSTYHLKLCNIPTSETVPRNFTMQVCSLEEEWEEGNGLDMNLPYEDLTYDIVGSNWIRRSAANSWVTEGAIPATPTHTFTQTFETGLEDLKVDITKLVEYWIDGLSGSGNNYGMAIRMTQAIENESRSYYTKKFYGRTAGSFYKKPVIEASWDSSTKDDRGNFYTSSSLAPAADNLNTLYLYNYSRGRLVDIPMTGSDELKVELYSTLGSAGGRLVLCNGETNESGSVGRVSTGIYSASLCVETTSDQIYDVWFSGSGTRRINFHTGSIVPKSLSAYSYSDTDQYVLTVSNKASHYNYDQTHRIRLYSREKNWSPNIYTTATSVPPSLIFESASYQVYRVVDDMVVIPYGTGSTQATRLSYDVSGNYFDLDASLLEPNYTYGINFSIYNPNTLTYEEQSYTYKIRVVKNEY